MIAESLILLELHRHHDNALKRLKALPASVERTEAIVAVERASHEIGLKFPNPLQDRVSNSKPFPFSGQAIPR